MPDSTKKILNETISKLKKVFEKIITPGNKEHQPQLVLQPCRTKKYF